MRKSIVVIALLLWISSVAGQYSPYSGEKYIQLQRVSLLERGKLSIRFFDFRAFGTKWRDKVMVWTDKDSLVPGKWRKFSADYAFGINYAFSNRFSAGVSFPIYGDFWEMKRADGREVRNWSSFGPGDFRADFLYIHPFAKNILMGLNTFITLPSGDQPSFSKSGNRVYKKSERFGRHYSGGLFRDFTSQSIDFGAHVMLNVGISKVMELGAQIGYFDAYQIPFADALFNGVNAGLAITYKATNWLTAIAEGYTFQFIPTKGGRAPFYLSGGLEFGPFAGLTIKLGGIAPLTDLEKVRPIRIPIPYRSRRFPYIFNGTIPRFNPSAGISFGVTYSHVFKAYDRGDIRGVVVDGATGTPIANAEVSIAGNVVSTDLDGKFIVTDVPSGILNIRARATGYEPGEGFVIVEANATTEKTIKLYKFEAREAVLEGKIVDGETNAPLSGVEITFPGSNLPSAITGSDGTFKVKTTSGVYTMKASMDGYRTEILSVYLPGDQTVSMEIPLQRMEKVAVGGFVLPVVYFDFDKYRIKREYYPILDIVAEVLKNNPDIKLELQGHASGEGPEAYNQKLAMKRAESVKRYLVERHGIDSNRLKTVSFGESKPAVPNDTGDHRYMNRRVEFRVIK